MEQVNQQITWLDYSIMNNLNGVLKVLADYGYIGMLAPQSIPEVKESALDIMEQYGDEGTVDVLKAHPEYPVFEEVFSGKVSGSYNNAISGATSKIESFVSKLKPIEQAVVAIGIFVGAYYVLKETKTIQE